MQAQASDKVPGRATSTIRGDKARHAALDKVLLQCNAKLQMLCHRMPGGEFEYAIIASARCLGNDLRMYASAGAQVR